MRRLRSVSALTSLFIGLSFAVPVLAQVSFTDVGSQFVAADNGHTLAMTWADWDGDGDYDLHVQNRFAPAFFYRNNLVENGTFSLTDVTALIQGPTSLNPVTGWSAAWGDFDEDGDPDLYLGNGDGTPTTQDGDNIFWRNDGGVFTDQTAAYGLLEPDFGQSVQWVDYDHDGLLDLHITMEFDPFRMMRQSAPGVFEDVSAATGLDDAQSHSYGLSWADFDGDGDLDAAVTTCGTSQIPGAGITVDRLFENMLVPSGAATFNETAENFGINYPGNMYGNEAGDPDNDGDWDLYVAGITGSQRNRFYENTAPGTLAERTSTYNLAGPSSRGSRGLEWVDFDNDGDLDLWVHDGGTIEQLYENRLVPTGTMNFTEIGEAIGLTNTLGNGYDGGWADVDNDGDLDLASPCQGQNELWINNGGNDNNWLFVKLVGSRDTLSGIGATIRVRTGTTWQMRLHGGNAGSFTQHSLPTHFGLGQADEVDEIEVQWVTGGTTSLSGPIDPNQTITIYQTPFQPGNAGSSTAAAIY